ncbi:MAG: transcription termination factor Rho [SAR202 cluster bacterium]|nr:transcription termination factor Rho [Chloroflexota bacterium]MQG17601.1 transcription termination factor Rho [SAR202 cluster bacterium]MQG35981.1 transcription termination factor Rho [SAR202 cluster bacterium]MQG86967.1 transcription termination factor Rho [SAR202 cluster bacterium]|tara:strand:+ start:1357 stop:2670 length:1314 start_codon:yes stop_codon:yes gene_type:complete
MATIQSIFDISELNLMTKEELIGIADQIEVEIDKSDEELIREDVLKKLYRSAASKNAQQDDKLVLTSSGILQVMDDGYGFLRQVSANKASGDVYISQSQIRRFGLRTGDTVSGQVRPPKDGERYFGLVRVDQINGHDSDSKFSRAMAFEALTPIFPEKQIILESKKSSLSSRMIDLFSPIGLGQRGLIVSPPKAGKTTILKQIAASVAENIPEATLMVVLIGERPEEVTEMRRSVQGDVFSSTFDESVEEQCRVAELALERSKRLVEAKEDVIILMDSMTRLTRAYNLAVPSSGRTLSGGMDPVALYPPKKFFGAARNIEEGGSLTILATCLVDTGSRMDEVIYEEFKGTGNMELHLDRGLADRRFFPAVDIIRSGTRREELFFDDTEMKQRDLLRRMVNMSSDNGSSNVLERVLDRVSKSGSNEEFLEGLHKAANS